MRTVISRAAVACLVVSTVSVTLGGAPAQARSAAVGGNSHHLLEGCHTYRYSFSFDHPGAYAYEADLSLSSPDGDWIDGDSFTSTNDNDSGHRTFRVCGSEGVGSYDIEGTVDWYDEAFDVIDTEPVEGTLQLVKRATRTTLAISDRTPRYNSIVRLTATSFDETASGWKRRDFEKVGLEGRCPGTDGWVGLGDSRTLTNDKGKASWRFRWNLHRTCTFRAVTFGDSESRRSRSADRTVNPSNRVVAEPTARSGKDAVPTSTGSILGR